MRKHSLLLVVSVLFQFTFLSMSQKARAVDGGRAFCLGAYKNDMGENEGYDGNGPFHGNAT